MDVVVGIGTVVEARQFRRAKIGLLETCEYHFRLELPSERYIAHGLHKPGLGDCGR